MLRVRVDYLPQGDWMQQDLIATIDIANDGSGTATHGNYTVKVAEERQDGTKHFDTLHFTGWDRSRPALEMLSAILHELEVQRAEDAAGQHDR